MSFTLNAPANAATLVFLGYRPNIDFIAGDAGGGATYVEWLLGNEPVAATVQVAALDAAKGARIGAINAECRVRIEAPWPDWKQRSALLGAYGQAALTECQQWVESHIDASNTASNAVIAAADLAAVEAVSVSWPAI